MPKEREQTFLASPGNNIKAARQALNLSRGELAEMANIAPRYPASIENNSMKE